MQTGEVLRRSAYNMLDKVHGGRKERLLAANKKKFLGGITPAYKERRLQKLLSYAKEHCEFYAGIGEKAAEGAAGCEPAALAEKPVKTLELSDFPVMKKTDYVEHREELLSDEYAMRKDTLARLTTSGSTGVPFFVYADREKMEHVYSNMLTVFELNGFRLGMKRAEFRVWIEGKNTISRKKSFVNNLMMYDISNMGDEALAGICQRLKNERIQAIVAYSSALTALCDYIRRKNVDLSEWSVEFVFSMGEALPKATEEAVMEIFGFPPVLSYGNNENGFIAANLFGSEKYIVDLYNYDIEILKLDSDEPAKEGELGRIVVTDYYNKAFPMIRYDTGDTGKYYEELDEKGRLHGYFTEIYGRRGSLLYSVKGEPLSIHCFMNVLIDLEETVRQAKCIQWERDRYEVLVNGEPGKVDEDSLVAAYRRYLGEEARIDVTYVDEIPNQASGKYLVCENRCPEYQP